MWHDSDPDWDLNKIKSAFSNEKQSLNIFDDKYLQVNIKYNNILENARLNL